MKPAKTTSQEQQNRHNSKLASFKNRREPRAFLTFLTAGILLQPNFFS